MPNDPDLNDPRNLWQNQEEERMVITLDDVRSRAARFERRIRRRNLREYVAGVIVIAFWGASPWFLPFRGRQLAAALLSIAGTIFVLVQLHRRGAAGSLSIDAGLKLRWISIYGTRTSAQSPAHRVDVVFASILTRIRGRIPDFGGD